MELVATKELRHAGTQYQAGDTFTANDRDGRILVAIGKAKLAKGDAESPEPTGKKRTYKRRDLKAE